MIHLKIKDLKFLIMEINNFIKMKKLNSYSKDLMSNLHNNTNKRKKKIKEKKSK
jgi:hypothetical protein